MLDISPYYTWFKGSPVQFLGCLHQCGFMLHSLKSDSILSPSIKIPMALVNKQVQTKNKPYCTTFS